MKINECTGTPKLIFSSSVNLLLRRVAKTTAPKQRVELAEWAAIHLITSFDSFYSSV